MKSISAAIVIATGAWVLTSAFSLTAERQIFVAIVGLALMGIGIAGWFKTLGDNER